MTPELYHDTPDLSTQGVDSALEQIPPDRKPAYYAIIPASVRYDDSIPANAKLLYGEISALADDSGYCYASNQYFANLYKVSERAISGWISALSKGKYIAVYVKKARNGQVQQRKIFLETALGMSTEGGQPVENIFHTPRKNFPDGVEEIFVENNTSNNIKKENKKEKVSFDPKPVFVEWIDKELPHLTAPHGEILGARDKNMLYIALVNFSENRYAMKKPIPSKAAVTAIMNRLTKFTKDAQNRVAAMIDLLELATSSNWQTVYAPKESTPSAPAKPQGGREYEEL